MKPIRKILAPTDLSNFPKQACVTLNLAKDIGAEVTVYHVVNSDELIRYGEEMKGKDSQRPGIRLPESFLEKTNWL